MSTAVVRPFVALLALLPVASGCGEEKEPAVEVHAVGTVDAFVQSGRTSFGARYFSMLENESCEVLDETTGCMLTRCTPDGAAGLEDAGEVVVGDRTLEIADDGSYSLELEEELTPGELLGLSASGSSAVPAHESEVVVPEHATLVEPNLDDPLVLDPAADFVLELVPVESDRVVVSLTSGELAIACVASGTAERITIASRLVAELPEDEPVAFRVINENLVDTTLSGWRIWFGAHQVVAEGTAELIATE